MMARILIFSLAIVWMTSSGQGLPQESTGHSDKAFPLSVVQMEKREKLPETEDEMLPYSYEQEIISKKLFQKNLPPLTKREKTIWAFKTAKISIFL